MKWLERTHGTKFELIRHFLGRMLDGEWSSMPGQWRNVAIGAITLALPGTMLLLRSGSVSQTKMRLLAQLGDPAPFRAAQRADELGLLTLLMTVTGLAALLQWQNFFPGRRDYLALAGLPVRSRQIFIARFAAVLLFSTTVSVALNLLPTITSPHHIAQAAAAGAGCFFLLFAIIALQGILLNLLSAKLFARVSTYVQGALIGSSILAGLYSWSIRDWEQATMARLPEYGAWVPPVWFLGLYQQLSNDADPFLERMATQGLLACLAAAGLALLSYLVSYRRYRKLVLEAPVHIKVAARRPWSLLRLVAGSPQQEAVMEFMARTLTRSRAHRLIWLAYVGAAIGVVINGSLMDSRIVSRFHTGNSALKFIVLFWPLATSVIMIAGFRHVLSIPAELPSNWIFRLTETQGRKEWMRAVERFVMLYAVAPIYVLITPLAVYILGWPLALRMTVQQVLLSLTIFELLFYSWQQLPFTCSYTPGKRPISVLAAAYFFILGIVVPLLSVTIRTGSEFTVSFLIYGSIFAGVWIWARRRRVQGWGESNILYEDLPDGVPNLGISELTWRPETR